MKSQDLRSSILQYAMEGKLVPQDSNEKSANILFDEIIKEKELLIEKKIIKREKALPKIEKDEIPFKIPTSWEWVRLKDVIYNYGQKKPTEDFCYIDVASIDNTIGSLKENIEILNPENAPSRARKIVKKGSILYSTVRPYLQNICIIDKDFAKEAIASTAFLVMNPIKILDKYLYYTVKSPFFNDYVESKMVGVAYPAINDRNLNSAVIPIPPLSEQERIVEKVEELFQRVDQYDVLEDKLSSLNENFPINMEKSILQNAFEGKLVSQDINDENAIDLIKRIETKKMELKKDKENKFKSSSKIGLDEIPYNIPSTWQWVRISDIVYSKGQKKPDSLFRYIDVASIDNNLGQLKDNPSYLEPEKAPSRARKIVNKGDIIYSTIRPYLKNICILEEEDKRDVIASTAFAVMTPIIVENTYLYYFLKSPHFNTYVEKKMNGVAYPAINEKNFYSALIPLPPIEEQKRIVNNIEELLRSTNLIREAVK